MAEPRIYLAPAAAGKTAFALAKAGSAVQGLAMEVRLVVPGRQQVLSCRRRLAMNGGALGVRVMTFDELNAECLAASGDNYKVLRQVEQYGLMRSVAASTKPDFYGKLTGKPGFIQMLQEFVAELKAARIWPHTFLTGVGAIGDERRLRELGLIYEAYQSRLDQEGWADYAGLAWLAAERLEVRDDVAADWPLLIIDGFDSFTQVQYDLLETLASRVGEFVVTLTGAFGDDQDRRVFRRFQKTCRRLEEILEVRAEPLPNQHSQPSPVLGHLESNLFEAVTGRVPGAGFIELIQAPNRAGETREALRWLKERLVWDGMRPGEVALLARDLVPYRPFILQVAEEFGLPVRLTEGLPLRESPIVQALLDLLRLVLAQHDVEGYSPALPRKGVVSAWRSPYFDWTNAYPGKDAAEPIGITPADADALDAAARWGQVIGGMSQWVQVMQALAGRASGDRLDDEQDLPDNVVAGQAARDLQGKLVRFLQRLLPPPGRQRYREFIRWLEDLIGSDPNASDKKADPTSLKVAELTTQDGSALADLEAAALAALKDVLRGLIWLEDKVGDEPVAFDTFFNELNGAVDAAVYQSPTRPDREEILVASVLRARGLPFKAVAVLGLAEGEFPATLGEDVFLPEADRDALRQGDDLAVDSAIESAEREFFYEAVTAASQNLLLTRPNLADSGAEWPPSPFWEEICRLVKVEPEEVKTDSIAPPQRAASRAELMESLVHRPASHSAASWLRSIDPDRWQRLEQAGRTFGHRYGASATAFDGDLTGRGALFADHFHPEYRWSPSSLENYLGCPLRFFVGKVLRLEPRIEPVEGLDVRQLGSIYHEILEALYDGVVEEDRNDPQVLLSALPAVAGPLLDGAPARQGFRETAWWQQTREEIVQNIARSVLALAAEAGRWIPRYFEKRFFGEHSLIVREGEDYFWLHGIVDRVDRDPDGRLRVIDYKTAGPYGYGKRALEEGEKLQLPLYALAAQDALGLGEPADGFYWHIRHAEASELRLADYGPQEAI
ncbi:MAG TPA: PD-(D/E)XK nuclease family protein, partial [Anaerolineae bacterium]|nr:PD-(D/E)XK nuclease family protein [Anaerolineae bacterium]